MAAKQKPDCTLCGRVMESSAGYGCRMDLPASAHSFHEVQLEHTRWQASWLMADSDAPPPSHPL